MTLTLEANSRLLTACCWTRRLLSAGRLFQRSAIRPEGLVNANVIEAQGDGLLYRCHRLDKLENELVQRRSFGG